jgi:hypothetical protein
MRKILLGKNDSDPFLIYFVIVSCFCAIGGGIAFLINPNNMSPLVRYGSAFVFFSLGVLEILILLSILFSED